MASSSSTTTPFKPSSQLQTKTPSSKAIAGSLPDSLSNASEARYWAEKFGLGDASSVATASSKQFAHFRQVKLNAGSSAIVHQLLFGPGGYKSKVPLATVCGPRVQLYGITPQSSLHRSLARHSLPYNSNANEIQIDHDKQVQTGGHLALAAAFRSDGRLLAIALDNGQIRISDTNSRATLCTWQTRSRLPVRAVEWFRDGQHVLAAGDDGRLTVWSLKQKQLGTTSNSSGIPVVICPGHGDAVRCAALWQLPAAATAAKTTATRAWPFSALAATGSYDHTVRLWNMDDIDTNDGESSDSSDRCLAVLHHGTPVETVLWASSSDSAVPVWLVSAGGTTIKVWNPLSGRCVSTTKTHHRKTITCLLLLPRKDFAEDKKQQGSAFTLHNRILSGGIDGLLRVHAWDNKMGRLEYLHGINLHTPITSLAATVNADRLAIATIDGTVLVRQRGPSLTNHKRKRPPPGGTYAFFTRGMNVDAVADDYVVTAGKKRKLQKFDVALKQFRYGDALDESLETRNPQVVVAVLEELGKRQGLTIALSNRDEETLEPILSFTCRYITRPRFSSLLIGVANTLIDIYGSVAGQSETIDELFAKLQNQVSAECKMQKMLMRVVGQLDATLAKSSSVNEK